jgi:S-adenosylmethionine:tRNA ribosyltransferase-isomerase
MRGIDINDYDYDLPSDRIAQYPVDERDGSRLLVYKNNCISDEKFLNIEKHLPPGSLLVFNNTRVIRARLLFQKDSGALIEILCLEPLLPSDYSLSFGSVERVEWKCIVGNLKKWKCGILKTTFEYEGKKHILNVERIVPEGEAWRIKFSWDSREITFASVIEKTGHMPLPPYINRPDGKSDSERYQTVYSKIKGSVAAPTAGLHFTESVLSKIRSKDIETAEVTLHVGAGTFQPVKADNVLDHEMHCEHFSVEPKVIELLMKRKNKIIAVGTTSVRTLESLYWLGVKLINNPSDTGGELTLGQWEPYRMQGNVSVDESMRALLRYLSERQLDILKASTGIMIIPGYEFRMTGGLVTNFHQPRSTLLLLISAWTGNKWKELYHFALENGFRFLSYGDSSLLLK